MRRVEIEPVEHGQRICGHRPCRGGQRARAGGSGASVVDRDDSERLCDFVNYLVEGSDRDDVTGHPEQGRS